MSHRDGILFARDDGQVYLGCADCGYGDDSPSPEPWDRAVDDLHEALRYWSVHRERVHQEGSSWAGE